ncbi:MAG: dephospho-CoA kinase [Muribaculaceae bacterium]|nr:dephospho-CoA kinase [Muribaculaceae bacterium]
MTQKKLIAITGGIGSGKSVVAKILRTMGYEVYDCDEQAKRLMHTSPIIRQQLTARFGKDIYTDNGIINKPQLSSIIFNDPEALATVNGIVHPVVKNDIISWHNTHPKQHNFVETAILAEAGMQSMIDEVWNITAPVETRIARVMNRNATTREKVMERINSQSTSLNEVSVPVKSIINDGNTAILPQIITLLKSLEA